VGTWPNIGSFLGFAFSGAKIRWSDKAFVRFKQRVKELTGRSYTDLRPLFEGNPTPHFYEVVI